ncbi:vacuolar protein sorting-associated protein 51 homolog [Actinidia eriantha]|uniref:vacuolar protein sorting-associated protein 51 homolog n=1 Tax=Actinidia eriantha TaxID=165200 RepID=UPI002587559E|nr:vacuolar protein sorting-associated protein 51 homolog [Actinidia eriantha]XP_057509815.1 vacuolar protein sorting-associated protein 51 homolog [Actinidia eriantha]XP_057509816.1 vacuolar protein sorting-associated protein 51 homolog [Actinidia eriantha]XP_057509817.1 vacuolar protein sorting-associated protein 51 homolog [Actinidia eriantha]XP_057509818.1 vacuolar protein sorting-associated protein 51 homolog [Actinidia eriantha]XP_057509820.1 vacuolar protein sorting-associated protein 5
MRRKKGVIWTDVLLMDEVLPEAALSDFSLEMPLQKSNVDPRREQKMNILCSLPLSKQKGSNRRQHRCPTGDFRQLLDDKMGLLVKLRDLIIDWVQEGFQDFFRKLDDHFLLLSGKTNSTGQDQGLTEGTSPERRTPKYKVLSGLVLVLAQLSVFIEQGGIPRITEEIAASFSGGGVRGYEYGPAFVPAEICCILWSAGEKFLHLEERQKRMLATDDSSDDDGNGSEDVDNAQRLRSISGDDLGDSFSLDEDEN